MFIKRNVEKNIIYGGIVVDFIPEPVKSV